MSLPSNIFGVDRSVVDIQGEVFSGRGLMTLTFMSGQINNDTWFGAWDMGMTRIDTGSPMWVPDWGSQGLKTGTGDYDATFLSKSISGFTILSYTSFARFDARDFSEDRSYTIFHYGNFSGNKNLFADGTLLQAKLSGGPSGTFNVNTTANPGSVTAPFPFVRVKWKDADEEWNVIPLV
jgi:hypothetical protein